MELIRVTSQTSCLSDLRGLLAKLEVISHELSKSQSGVLNALYKYTVVWLDFYGGVYVQRRLLDSSAELDSYCSSPVFGSTIEGQSIPNTSIDQLCQIDIINFLITCLLHMSIRSLSKPESKYSKSLCSHLIVKPETSGIGLDILFLPLCLIPAAQLSTSTQRAWWSAFIKQVIESGSRSTINDSDRALLRCGLNQLRLVFHPTSCLNGGKGIMNPPLLFRVAQALTHIVPRCSPKKMENIEIWPLHYWEAALKNHILGPSNEPRTSVLQSLSGSFCSGYTNSGVSNCLSPLRNRNITQPSKSELTGSHILFVLPSSYNGWRGVFNDSASVVSLSRHWCNTGWLWCFDKLESRSKTADKLDTIDESLLRSLIRLCELLNSLILKSKSHGINNLKADFAKASSIFDNNQDFSGLESQSSKPGSFVKTSGSNISVPIDLSNSVSELLLYIYLLHIF
ncbi:unnamed protein product [Trichobilharzia regenti]|nr:unnamed protein product [Trichobilharzia regenti]